MDSNGYIVLRGWLKDMPSVDGIRTAPIFNDNPSARTDRRRKQATLRTTWARRIRERLAAEWPGLTLLESEPGCQRQAAHCDYVPSSELACADPMPLLVLIAIEPNTTLDVWPLSWQRQRVRKTIALDAGDALVFRADLIHAGSAYEMRNRRIHFYLDSPVVQREPNRTWIIYKHAPTALIDET